jgi:hypothetical protein
VLWDVTISTSYTDGATKVSSFYGYGTFPPNPEVGVGYYVEAFVDGARSGYGVFATYIPIGEPPY